MRRDVGCGTWVVALLILSLLAPIALAYPAYVGAVNDFANIIEPADEARIATLIEQIRANSTVEIAVVTTNDLEGEDISTYATNIGNAWGVGKKDTDNGLVLVIAPNDRKFYFAIGTGLEGTINDAKAGRIGRQVLVPYFRSGEYGVGIYDSLLTVQGLVANDPSIVSEYASTAQNTFYDAYETILVFGLFILFAVLQQTTAGKTTGRLLGYRIGAWTLICIAAAFILLPLFAMAFILSFLFFMITIFELIARTAGFKGGGGLGGFGGLGGGSSGGGFSFGGGGFSGGGGGGSW